MGYYDFKKDLEKSEEGIKDLLDILEKKGFKCSLNDTNHHDIQIEFPDGHKRTIELKEDFASEVHNNIAIEFECRKKPSGIVVTKADFWVSRSFTQKNYRKFFMISVSKLRKAIAEEKYVCTTLGSGDKGSNTKLYLFKEPAFVVMCVELK